VQYQYLTTTTAAAAMIYDRACHVSVHHMDVYMDG